MLQRILVATDRSETAGVAVSWAAEMAQRFGSELLLLQVLAPEGDGAAAPAAAGAENQTKELASLAEQLAGERGRARVAFGEDPAKAIVDVAHEEGVDVVVVGNVGMGGRKEFLLGNVPNRVSHNAQCTVIIVNTAPGGEPIARVATRDLEEDGGPPPHLLGRAARIGKVMAKYGAKEVFGGRRAEEEDINRVRARRLRSALEDLGPTFSKLGQILSTRPDLLPPEFIEELSTLQDRVTPMTEEEVVSVMEQELGVPWEDVFASIDPEPLAAGTMAQVHRATLETGDRVVVKVQRPTAKRDIMEDLGLLELFAKKTQDRPAFSQVFDMPAIIQHLSDSLKRELDFRLEASNLERMREVLEPYTRLDVPGVYSDYTTDRLLVMEEIQGKPIRETGDSPERRESGRQLLESFYRQILTDGFFHADPHPGNLMWLDGKIFFLDLGMVGEVGPELRELLLLLLMAFWQEDVAFLSDVVLMLAGEEQRGDLDIEKFQEELGNLLARYRHVSLKEIQLGPILQELTEIAIRYDVRLPASLALTGKALAQMQLATAELDPTLDPFAIAGSFVVKRMTQQVSQRLNPQRLFYEGQKIRMRITRLVEAIERLAGARPGPKLQVKFTGLERLEDQIRRGARRLAIAMTAGAALVATAVMAVSARVPSWIPLTFGIVGGLFVAGLLVDVVRRRR